MAEGLHIDPMTVARRCSVKLPDYPQLTPLDWVVLDFTDGLRTFEDLLKTLPVRHDSLAEAYLHLRLLGFITWKPASRQKFSTKSQHENSGMPSNAPYGSGNVRRSTPPSAPTFSGYDDDTCAKYIPKRMFAQFRSYTPKLFDIKLELPQEIQAFVEFIYDNLSDMTPCELLGIRDGETDKNVIRQAYINRTKQFHPDRYFRKNLGQYSPRINAIFKAISNAFNTLQAQ